MAHAQGVARQAVAAALRQSDLQDQGLYIMPQGRHVCYVLHYKASQLDECCGGSGSNHHYICPHLQQWERLPVGLITDAAALASEQNRLWSADALRDCEARTRAEVCLCWKQLMTQPDRLVGI